MDTTFPAVGNIGGCTATLIGPEIVITSAHCFGPFADGCQSESQAIANKFFSISRSGSGVGDTVSYAIDGVVVFPGAYSPQSAGCPAGSVNNCGTLTVPYNFGLHRGKDVALLHLATSPTQTPPAIVANPMRVVTGINDSRRGPIAIHARLQPTLARSAIANIVGWGNDDFLTPSVRRSGQAAFDSSWDLFCDAFSSSCNNAPRPPSTCPFRNGIGDVQAQIFRTHRSKDSQGNFIGPNTGGGDSGGPLIVQGGTGPGQVPEVPDGEFVILGTLSSGSTTPKGTAEPFNQDRPSEYSVAFADDVGAWIERRLTDFDADGIPDFADNCPAVAELDQHDSNFDAELTKAAQGGVVFPSEGHVPDVNDNVLYAEHFHTWYKGDACDTDAVTELSSFDTENGTTGPCLVRLVGGASGSFVDPTRTCPSKLNTGIQFDSYIGRSTGDAPSAPGTSDPGFCACPTADSSDPDEQKLCQMANFGCFLANDRLFGTPTTGDPNDNWQSLTQRTPFGHDQIYPPLVTLFQERVDPFAGFVPRSLLTTWNFPLNLVNFRHASTDTAMAGLLWGHVLSMRPQPTTDFGNNYLPITATIGLGEVIKWVPSFKSKWVPGGWGDPRERVALGDVPWLSSASSSVDTYVIEERQLGSKEVTSRFSADGLRVLSQVAAGTAELLVGDDVATTRVFRSRQFPAVIVEPGTINFRGALVAGGSQIGGFLSGAGGASDPPGDQRAYGAQDRTLFLLHPDALGATLATQLVNPLGGRNEIRLSGDVPAAPLAMVWNTIEKTLFVADVAPGQALRMVAVSLDGISRELWRTRALRHLPERVFLSASPENEIVLSLSKIKGHPWSEVVLFNSAGLALHSADTEGDFLAGALASPIGITLPMERVASAQHGNLDVRLVTRRDTIPGVCGARWLSRHAAETTPFVLGHPKTDCRDRGGDDDDDEGDRGERDDGDRKGGDADDHDHPHH